MAELDSLIKKRANVKRSLTRFKNYLDKTDFDDDSSTRELEQRLANVQTCLSEFNAVQDQIEYIEPVDDSHDSERELFENTYYSITTKARIIIENSQHLTNINNGGSIESGSLHSRRDLSHIKLPTLSLPSFNGEYDQWLNFYDTFKSLINDNEALTNIQRFHYLRSALKGEASLTIQAVEVSAENYDIAWGLLKDRFENKPLIIHNHVKALFDMEAANKESLSSLQYLLNSMQKHLRALKMLKQPVEHWDTLIIHLMSTKFDNITKREWEKVRSELVELPTVDNISTFLMKKCQLLESLQIGKQK